jgi:hypothetical protein
MALAHTSIPSALDRPNRTFISSVLFLDIVDYTRQPVTEQIRLKEQFNLLVSHLISDIPENDRIVLDTGDGAALSFLGDPEDALFVAVKLRDAIKEKQSDQFPDLHLRMGIHLGPVKLLKDINGRPNLIGDGINNAQRVMNFAAPDQILVSRSFYDVVSCLSDEYRNLFSHRGTQTDKHVREHELYEIGFVDPDRSISISRRMQALESHTRVPPEQLALLERALRPHVGEHAHVLVQAKAAGAADFFALRDALAAYIADAAARAAFMRTEPRQQPRSAQLRKWALLLGAAAGLAGLIGLGWWIARPQAPPGGAAPVAQMPPAAATAAVSADAPAASPAARAQPAQAIPPAPMAPARSGAKNPRSDSTVARAASQQAEIVTPPSPAAPTSAAPAGSRAAAGVPMNGPPRTAALRFQVSGNAEIYVDGIRAGNSAAVSQYPVAPGAHRVEFRDCGFPPGTKNQSVSVDAGDLKLVVNAC